MDLFGKNEIDVRVFAGEWFGKKFNVDAFGRYKGGLPNKSKEGVRGKSLGLPG